MLRNRHILHKEAGNIYQKGHQAERGGRGTRRLFLEKNLTGKEIFRKKIDGAKTFSEKKIDGVGIFLEKKVDEAGIFSGKRNEGGAETFLHSENQGLKTFSGNRWGGKTFF